MLFALVALLVLAGCSKSGSQERHPGAERAGSGQSGARTATGQTRTGPQEKTQSAAQFIPGLNAARMARVFEHQGLGCKQPGGSATLYDCTSEGNPDLSLLYVGQVTGAGPKLVRSVAAEVVMTAGGGDMTSAAQSFFGVVASRMDYQGADADKATAFVYEHLSSTNAASITIGAAKWTLLSNAEAKVLEVSSVK